MPAPDPASPVAGAIRVALRENEIGNGDPYAMSFAGRGKSGPSFGIFQADMAANAAARNCLLGILMTYGVAGAVASRIVGTLGHPLQANPLDTDDQAIVAAAMASDAGRAAIDALDAKTFGVVLADVGTAIDAAATVGKTLDLGATIAIALWSNMTGLPSTLDRWIGGETINEPGGPCAPPAGDTVTQEDVLGYLALTEYFHANPHTLPHFEASIAAGLAFQP